MQSVCQCINGEKMTEKMKNIQSQTDIFFHSMTLNNILNYVFRLKN
jgi:hypothetical protein